METAASDPFELFSLDQPDQFLSQGLNTINQRPSESILSVNQLRSVAGQMDDDPCLKRTPDRKIVLAMDFRVMDNPRFHDEELYSVEDVGGRDKLDQKVIGED